MIDTIFFDVGGVLVTDLVDRKYQDLARKYRLDVPTLLKTRAKFRPPADLGKISDAEFWRRCLEEMGITAQADDFELESYYQEVEGSREIVLGLKAKGYHLAIITDDSREMALVRRRRYGYDGLFEKVIVSAECGMVKPNEGIYLYALQQMQATAEKSLFIDNLEINLAGARAVHMHTLLFEQPKKLNDDLIALGLL